MENENPIKEGHYTVLINRKNSGNKTKKTAKIRLLKTDIRSQDYQTMQYSIKKSGLDVIVQSGLLRLMELLNDRGIEVIQLVNNDRVNPTSTYLNLYSFTLDNPEQTKPTPVVDYRENHFHTFPLFFGKEDEIKIPSKVNRVLNEYTPRDLLRKINPDLETAIELCLIFINNLNVAHKQDNSGQGWKELSSTVLDDMFGGHNIYKEIINALMYEGKNGAILIRDNQFIVAKDGKEGKCYYYRLNSSYQNKGMGIFKLKTDLGKRLCKKRYYKILAKASENIICKNLLNVYGDLLMPTEEYLLETGKRLVKMKHITKKGKKLIMRNKHPDSYFKNIEFTSFVEDNIQKFKELSSYSYLIPQASSPNNGGRVIDSFTLMPSWIRSELKIDDKKLVEVDFSALHPNCAMSIYGGKRKFITHQAIGKEAGLEVSNVKKEHLSFFNKELWQMQLSPLFKFYCENEPEMMANLIEEKLNNYLYASRKMLTKEVEIMTDAIKKMNEKGIYVLYVYDAVMCQQKDKIEVTRIMNETILEHGVYTVAK